MRNDILDSLYQDVLDSEEESNRSGLGEVLTGAERGAMVELPRMVGEAAQGIFPDNSEAANWGADVRENAERRGLLDEYTLHPEQHGGVTNAFASGASNLPASMALMATTAIAPEVGLPATLAMYGGSSYQEEYEKQIAAGTPEGEARKAALGVGLVQGAGETMMNTIGARFLKGAASLTGKQTVEKVLEDIANKGALGKFAKQAAGEVAWGTGTEIAQDVGSAVVSDAYSGQDTDLLQTAIDTAGPAAAMETLFLPFGGLGHFAAHKRNKQLLDIVEDNGFEKEERLDAAIKIYQMLEPVDKQRAKEWAAHTVTAINNNERLDILNPAKNSEERLSAEVERERKNVEELRRREQEQARQQSRAAQEEQAQAEAWQRAINRDAVSDTQFGEVIPGRQEKATDSALGEIVGQPYYNGQVFIPTVDETERVPTAGLLEAPIEDAEYTTTAPQLPAPEMRRQLPAPEMQEQTQVQEDQLQLPAPQEPLQAQQTATLALPQLEQAASEVNTAPSDAQKEAGNYKKGHVRIGGLDISLENPRGSTRSGTDETGKPWQSTMQNHYGYVRGTKGFDKAHVDVFLSDNPEVPDGKIFVIDQINPETGKFDEHKVMYGFANKDEALAAYKANYNQGQHDGEWQGAGEITQMSKDEFNQWVKSDMPSKGAVSYLEPHQAKKVIKDFVHVAAKEGTKPRNVQAKTALDVINRHIENLTDVLDCIGA